MRITSALRACLVCTLLVGSVSSQASFATFGAGLLDSSYLKRPGGLIFPNADGSGPQADSLAAAIYGVALPNRFEHFAASENYFGASNNPYQRTFGIGGINSDAHPSEFLIGSGININGDRPYHQESGGGDSPRQFSAYVTDFSSFSGDYAAPPPDNDLSGAPSNNNRRSGLNQIDPIAARFGVILPDDDNLPAFDASTYGSSANTAGFSSTGGGQDETNSFYGSSPIQMSLHFDLPTKATLPDLPLTGPPTSDVGGGGAEGRSDDSLHARTEQPPSSLTNPESAEDNRGSIVDVITSAFKLPSEDRPSMGAEPGGNSFEQASGKFSSTPPTEGFDFGSFGDSKPFMQEAGSSHSPTTSEGSSNPPTTTPASPYGSNYRERERHHLMAEQSATTNIIARPQVADRLTAASGRLQTETTKDGKRANYRNPYTFIMAPGYRTVRGMNGTLYT